jgi:nucleotide-binding universal stress UspA family protein
MAERQVLADDARMVSTTQPSNAARHSKMVPHKYDFVGAERTIVCGLDAVSRNEPIRFAACLARRLEWRLELVPLPEAATQDERVRRLLATSARDQAGIVVTGAFGRGPGAALVELSRGGACPLIAVPRGAPSLGTGPILCGIDSRGPLGPTALAASRLANALGAPLRLVHVVPHAQSPESGASSARGVVWHALHGLDLAVPVDLLIDEGEPAERLGELGRRENAALVAVGAPSGDNPDPDGAAAAVLRDSQIPVMVVPRSTAVARLDEAA